MSKGILDNIVKAKWTLGILAGALYLEKRRGDKNLQHYIFGADGMSIKN
jgi:hypothetical protein